MANTRLYYASAVLDDGRVFVAGGEYSDAPAATPQGRTFQPGISTSGHLFHPSRWNNIGDAPCTVLPEGRLLLGSIFDQRRHLRPRHECLDRRAQTRTTPARRNLDASPDETVLSAECSQHPKTEKNMLPAAISGERRQYSG